MAVIALVICLVGVSSVFAGQSAVQTATSTAIVSNGPKSTQGNPGIDFLVQLPGMTVKYLMPIEMALSAIPGIGMIFGLEFFVQAFIMLLPIWLILTIF